jgi:hypothetical protein
MEDKMKKKIFGMMILALLVLSFGFLSCKQEVGGNSNPFIGTWICSSEGLKFEFTENQFFVKELGTNSIDGFGIYSYLGNNYAELVVSDGSDSGTAIISGNTLTVTMSSATYYCTKQ